ncbi:phage tail protein [Pseudomonas proteolytica]|uniref:phage tail protein n=1 Tax=Pseudomonas proteolytica TaxID=219574 RepID=UPI0021CCCA80|nr:phage tail protein [Pseudomonas proteolytica]
MIDQNSQFQAILTAVGEAKQANADALGIPWTFAQMGVGDANGTDPFPDRLQTKLINERRRAPLNQLKPDPKNPGIIIAEQVIPETVGGFWIREIALYDQDGDLVAVANCAPTFKPLLDQGSGRTQIIRMNLIVSSIANIVLKIDPAVVLATREYVDLAIVEALNKQDFKASMLVATTAPIVLSGLQVIDGVAVPAGARVLVKNQASAKDNGLWRAAAGAWSRTPDADADSEVTPGMVVMVETGTTQADTLWELVTDGAVTVGVTPLNFKNITEGFARIDSPVLIGTPRAPTPPQFDISARLATMEALQRVAGSYRGEYAAEGSSTLSAAHVGQVGYIVGDGGYTIKLPPTAGMLPGVVIRLLNRASTAITLESSTGPISGAVLTPEGAVSLRRSASIELYWNGSAWVVFGGSEATSFAGFASLASPSFTGIATAPTATLGTNSQQLANTAFVWTAVNTYATTVTAALGLKANLASPTFTGLPTAPTAAAGTNSLQLANTAFVWASINTYATTVTASLSLKANLDSPDFTGVPKGPTPDPGTNTKQLVNAEFVQAALAALDPWALVPVGSLVPLMDNSSVQAPSRNSAAYKYIRLTASDGYNSPVLVSESVSGTAPLVIATGVISLAGSPLDGLRINLINTERRYLRAGLPGVVEQDALQGHFHNVLTGTGAGTGLGSGTSTGGSNLVNDIVPNGGRVQGPASDGTSGAVRTAAETRVKSMGVTYYLRIK